MEVPGMDINAAYALIGAFGSISSLALATEDDIINATPLTRELAAEVAAFFHHVP